MREVLKTMSENTPDWTINELYQKAWQIVKKNKVLWIFGLALSGLGISFNNFRTSNSFQDLQKFFPNNNPHQAANPFSQVLGVATSSPFTESIKQIFSSIPSYLYILLALEVTAALVIGVVITLIYQAWAQGSLISGTKDALEEKEVSIKNASSQTFPVIKSLIWLNLVPNLVVTLLATLLIGVMVAGIIIASGPLKIIFWIGLIFTAIGLVITLIFLSLAQVWAPRIVIFNQTKAKAALFQGIKISKKKFWAMVLLGLVNLITSLLITGIPLVVITILVVGAIFAFKGALVVGTVLINKGNPTPAIFGLLAVGGLLAIPLIIGFSLLSGIITSFKATLWTIAYQKIKGKYE